jgi:hypothetical protein
MNRFVHHLVEQQVGNFLNNGSLDRLWTPYAGIDWAIKVRHATP